MGGEEPKQPLHSQLQHLLEVARVGWSELSSNKGKHNAAAYHYHYGHKHMLRNDRATFR